MAMLKSSHWLLAVTTFLLLLIPFPASADISILLPKDGDVVPPYTTQLLAERLSCLTDQKVVVDKAKSGDILIDLRIDPKLSSGLGMEGYSIKANKSKVIISSASGNGLMYGSCRLIEWIMGQTTAGLINKNDVDIDFPVKKGQAALFVRSLPEWSVSEKPFYSERSAQLTNLGLGVADLLGFKKSSERPGVRGFSGSVKAWKDWCDWLARHRMNSITNWPYSVGTNWWELANDPATEGMSLFSREEIEKAAKIREELFRYARSRGLRPYLMNYVPGGTTQVVKEKRPEMVGKKFHARYPEPYNLSSPLTTDVFCKQIRAITRTYPSLEGYHLRWWYESFVDPGGGHQKVEDLTLAMMKAAKEERSDVGFIISGYFRMGGTKEFADRMPGSVIIQSKWGADWEPVPDPGVPFEKIAELNRPFLISQALPSEEFHSIGSVQYRSLGLGVMKYVNASDKLKSLAGFATVVGEKDHEWVTETNFIAMARMNWDPKNTDIQALVKNYIATHYGSAAAEPVYKALDLTQDVSEKFVVDFAGICPFIDCARTYGMFGTSRAAWLSGNQLRKGLNDISWCAQELAKAVDLLKGVENKVEEQGRESFRDLMIQTQWFADFYASRQLMTEAFIDKKNGDIDAMASKLTKLREMSKGLADLAQQKPNISDYFEMEGWTRDVNLHNAHAKESKEIDAILAPDNIATLKRTREIEGEPLELSALGEVGDKFTVTVDVPDTLSEVKSVRLCFMGTDLDGLNAGDEGEVTVFGKTMKLAPTEDGKGKDYEFVLDPADFKTGKTQVEFTLAGRPQNTRGYYVKGTRLIVEPKQ